ncbi:class I SAM-dependent methyltransferase [Trichothermofontia sp.]
MIVCKPFAPGCCSPREPGDVLDRKARFFDRWALTYDWLLPSVFYQAVHQRLLEYVQLPDAGVVLDIGCGTGRLLNRLASRYPNLRGYGLDLAPVMLQQARQRNQHRPRLIFKQGRSDAIPFGDRCFDAAFSTISFLHYPDPQAVMGEVYRVLQPGGRFYLVDYTTTFWMGGRQAIAVSPGGLRFYSRSQRQQMGEQAKLTCISHQDLIGPVLLTIFQKAHEGKR